MRDTIDLAREAGATVEVGMAPVFNTHAELKAFEALVRADEREVRSMRWDEYIAKAIEAEREACAKECKFDRTSADIEIAIRARGKT
jgi:hypothetical protein